MGKNAEKPVALKREGPVLVSSFWHWRLKKRLYAADYGYKCFPIGGRRRS